MNKGIGKDSVKTYAKLDKEIEKMIRKKEKALIKKRNKKLKKYEKKLNRMIKRYDKRLTKEGKTLEKRTSAGIKANDRLLASTKEMSTVQSDEVQVLTESIEEGLEHVARIEEGLRRVALAAPAAMSRIGTSLCFF